jgi:hypothetical protein
MSAAKHPYDIRNERGEFASVTPEVRAALEAMRAPPAPYCDEIYRPANRSLWQRIREYFMWHPR